MTDLTDIDGVGPAYAEELEDSGYESAEDVADADPDELDDVLASASGEDLVESATEEVDDEPATTDDADDSDLISLGELNEDQVNHAIYALVNREINARQTNDRDNVEIVKDAIDELRGDPPYEFTLDQLTQLYTGINQHENDLRSRRGIGGFVSEIRNLRTDVQDARSENWPE